MLALRSQLQASSTVDSISEPDIDVRIQLESARRDMAKYERMFGPETDVAEDVKSLAQRLQQSGKEKQGLEIKLAESEAVCYVLSYEDEADASHQSTNALYAEVEGLSKLWEGLQETLRTKVFDLKDGELKMSRLTTEVSLVSGFLKCC